MSKLNPLSKSTIMVEERLAGGSGMKAANQSNINLLRRAVLANLLWEDIAYMDGKSVTNEIKRLVPLCSALDVVKLVKESKFKQKLRHVPLFLIVEMCKYTDHKAYVKELLPQVITRPDMMTDFLTLYWEDGKCPICNQAKKGLALSFYNFDEYAFAKYDRNAPIKLRDVMFLCRPKPRNEEETMLFKKIADRTLKTPDTWEVALSTGQNKKESWTRLINEGKLGGLAMLRNLNNMKKANVDANVIRKGLNNIKSAMLLPLNFFSAQHNAPEFTSEIERIMLKSYRNLPKLPGKTLFIVDISGSMISSISNKSIFNRLDAAKAMSILAINCCEDFKIVCTAGKDPYSEGSHAEIEYPVTGFGLKDQISNMSHELGWGGIFTRQCLEWCQDHFKDQEFDRIIVFSDSQDCDRINKLPKPFGKYNYICDVSCHTKGINYKGVWTAEISGFSENFLNYIAVYEGLENNFEN